MRQALATRFNEAVRQALKHDAAMDGRAAYAMQLGIAGALLTRTAATLEHSEDNATALAAVRATLADLLPGLVARRMEVRRGIEDLARWLGDIQALVRKDGDRTRHAVERGNELTQSGLAEIKDQNAAILALLQVRQTPKIIGETAEQEALPPELMEKVRELYERGKGEEKARAAIELKKHEEADRIVQGLKRAPLAETFRLLTLEGDNWCNAGDFDRAIQPYERALALRPDDPDALYSAGSAHAQARLGNMAAHRHKAIELLTRAHGIGTREAHPAGWAMTQISLGVAWQSMPTGDRVESLRKAIDAFAQALQVLTRDARPVSWALAQHNLGVAWQKMPTGDPAENLRKAIAAYTAALEIRTREARPVDWAMTRFYLGLAYRDRSEIGGGRLDLEQAIASVRAAAGVWTESDFPFYCRNQIAPALELLRTAWVAGGQGTQAEFDAIRAAE